LIQKRQLDKDEDQLNEALEIIKKVLNIANIDIIEIVLGKTIFDSKIHIARTTTNTPNYPNNTISSVIRNGFRLINGNIIQQPEVIVNKRM
jgi:molecular chaperone GrpE (heat shock protein)